MTSKILLGTTALAAILFSTGAQAADDGLSLKMAGWFRGYAQFGSLDDNPSNGLSDRRNVSFETFDSEIHFIAEAKTANGLTYGFRIELEGASVTDQIDESYLYVKGSLGDVFFGNDDGAANKLAYQVPAITRSKTLVLEDPNFSPNAPTGSSVKFLNSPNHYSLDSAKIFYATPRMSGFQLGVSYAPDLSEDPNSGAVAGGFETDNDVQAGDAIELGLNYSNKFGDLGLVASVTYYTESLEDGATLATQEERDSYAAGAGISYKGLQLGANYMYTENYAAAGYTAVGVDGSELNQFVVGVQYATGPWSVGANAGYGKVEFDGGREDELLALLGGVGYNVAPGLDLDAAIQYYDWDRSGGTAVANDSGSGASTALFLGTTLSF